MRKITVSILFLLFIFFTLVQLYLSNRLSADGQKLDIVQARISQANEENNKMKKEIATLGCISSLTSKAKEKGFISNPSIINMTGKVPIAAQPE